MDFLSLNDVNQIPSPIIPNKKTTTPNTNTSTVAKSYGPGKPIVKMYTGIVKNNVITAPASTTK